LYSNYSMIFDIFEKFGNQELKTHFDDAIYEI